MLRYAISNGTYQPGDATRWAAQSLDFVQLREKNRTGAELLQLTREVLRELHGTPTRLLLNGPPDIAVASGAHGVHLTSAPNELTPTQVRAIFSARSILSPLSPTPCISISCHTLAEVRRAHEECADLILFGPVFEKRVARHFIHDGSGLDLLHQACLTAARTPVLALGGITAENTAACLAAGAAGIAAIRLFA